MKLSDKTYDILAFIGRILLPAIAVAYGNLADIWGLPLKAQIVQTLGVVGTLILNIFLQEVAKNHYANEKSDFSAMLDELGFNQPSQDEVIDQLDGKDNGRG